MNNIKGVIRDESLKLNVVLESSGPRGKSAYETWLKNGGVGTEEDFLEDLRVPMELSTFIYQQQESRDTWVINHNLNRLPSCSIIDTGGSMVLGNIEYLSKDTIILTFNAPFSGEAYLN